MNTALKNLSTSMSGEFMYKTSECPSYGGEAWVLPQSLASLLECEAGVVEGGRGGKWWDCRYPVHNPRVSPAPGSHSKQKWHNNQHHIEQGVTRDGCGQCSTGDVGLSVAGMGLGGGVWLGWAGVARNGNLTTVSLRAATLA